MIDMMIFYSNIVVINIIYDLSHQVLNVANP